MGITVTTMARRSRLVIAGKSYRNSAGGGRPFSNLSDEAKSLIRGIGLGLISGF